MEKYNTIEPHLKDIFCSKNPNETNKKLLNSFLYDNNWCASNKHIMVMIPTSLIVKPKVEYNIKSVVDKVEFNRGKLFHTSFDVLKKSIIEGELTARVFDYTDKCPKCLGGGAEANLFKECKKCGGIGTVGIKVKTKGVGHSKGQVVKVIYSYLNPDYIRDVIEAIELMELQNEEIIVGNYDDHQPVTIQVNNIKFILMPIHEAIYAGNVVIGSIG